MTTQESQAFDAIVRRVKSLDLELLKKAMDLVLKTYPHAEPNEQYKLATMLAFNMADIFKDIDSFTRNEDGTILCTLNGIDYSFHATSES